MSLISVREYAGRVGVSHTAVLKWARRGMPRVDGKIDPAIADAWRASNLTASQAVIPDAPQAPPEVQTSASVEQPRPVSASLGPSVGTIAHAQLQVLEAKAEKAQLDLEERKGTLIAVEEYEQVGSEIITSVTNRLLLIPDLVCDQMAATRDPLVCRSILEHEIRLALDGVSRLGRVA